MGNSQLSHQLLLEVQTSVQQSIHNWQITGLAMPWQILSVC
jgi:hypothetical protein